MFSFALASNVSKYSCVISSESDSLSSWLLEEESDSGSEEEALPDDEEASLSSRLLAADIFSALNADNVA